LRDVGQRGVTEDRLRGSRALHEGEVARQIRVGGALPTVAVGATDEERRQDSDARQPVDASEGCAEH
jgi:hypothetical protein